MQIVVIGRNRRVRRVSLSTLHPSLAVHFQAFFALLYVMFERRVQLRLDDVREPRKGISQRESKVARVATGI